MEDKRNEEPVWTVGDSVLSLVAVKTFAKLWDDKKTGCPHGDVSFLRPQPPEGYFIVGDAAVVSIFPSL